MTEFKSLVICQFYGVLVIGACYQEELNSMRFSHPLLDVILFFKFIAINYQLLQLRIHFHSL